MLLLIFLYFVIQKVMFLGSSEVEQVAVNHWVGGSSPSRGAIFGNNHEILCWQ